MNNDLISREALRKDIEHLHSVYAENKEWFYTDVLDHIDKAPTVEIDKLILIVAKRSGKRELMLNALRPHGEWIEVEPHQSDLEEGIDYREECSICHEPNRHYGLDKYYNISFVTYYKTNFCPNCGADMRGGRQC